MEERRRAWAGGVMMKKSVFAVVLTVFFFVCWGSSNASFLEDIKERMKNRLTAINALKADGMVGENKDGYLEFLGEKKQEDVVKAENEDREKVYRAIAKQQGTTAEVVGKRRALQIAEGANPGEWVQDDNGAWRQVK
jgi:uncharacterized protein YdbL (DUF1318 family)